MSTLSQGTGSESNKTQNGLSESEHRYRELADSLPNIVFETDINGQVLFTNKIGYETSGYTQEEIEKGLNIMQCLPPEERERALNNIQSLLAGRALFLSSTPLCEKMVQHSPHLSQRHALFMKTR